MTKIPRDAKAFARRVKMSSQRLWLLVEGRSHDRPFYDRVLGAHDLTAEQGYAVRLAEQIELNGLSAGGKDFVKSLHAFFESEGVLSQSNSRGPRLIAFALDSDFERISGQQINSPHVLYTQGMDVEAEIILNADVQKAASSAYSLTRDSVAAVIPDGRDLAVDLANRWRRWIEHGAIASCYGLETGVRFSQTSKMNAGGFGECIESVAGKLESDLKARLAQQGVVDLGGEQAKLQIDALFASDGQWLLVKGRWLARFVAHLLKQGLDDAPREASIPVDTLSKTCLETIDFSGPWVSWYHRRLDALSIT